MGVRCFYVLLYVYALFFYINRLIEILNKLSIAASVTVCI